MRLDGVSIRVAHEIKKYALDRRRLSLLLHTCLCGACAWIETWWL